MRPAGCMEDCGACARCDEADYEAHDEGGDLPACACDACRRVRARAVRELRPVAGGIVSWARGALGLMDGE